MASSSFSIPFVRYLKLTSGLKPFSTSTHLVRIYFSAALEGRRRYPGPYQLKQQPQKV